MPFVYRDSEGGYASCPTCLGRGVLFAGTSTTTFDQCWACDGSGRVFFRPLRPLTWEEPASQVPNGER